MADYPLMYHVVPTDNFEAEGRYFLENEQYPVYNRGGNCLLCAENGEFLFTKDLMQQAITEWKLDVVNLPEGEVDE